LECGVEGTDFEGGSYGLQPGSIPSFDWREWSTLQRTSLWEDLNYNTSTERCHFTKILGSRNSSDSRFIKASLRTAGYTAEECCDPRCYTDYCVATEVVHVILKSHYPTSHDRY